jgi:uncharacterized membrane protein
VNPSRFRVVVSGVLIVGVLTSAVLMSVGFIASLAVGWEGSLRGLPTTMLPASDFSAIGTGMGELRPIAFAQAGLLVLIATPVVRVMASVVAFVLGRDRLYAAITIVVLAILLASLFGLR